MSPRSPGTTCPMLSCDTGVDAQHSSPMAAVGHAFPSPSAMAAVGLCVRSKKGEDAMSWLEAEAGGEALLLIMVADGHAGSEAAQISADNALPLVVSKTKDGSAASLQAALRCVCERLHSLVVSTSGTAGTTLTIVVWNAGRGELTICNLGDSAAVLVSATGHTLLTTDHRLSESPEEFERVRAAGARIGRVKRDGGVAGGPLRAWPGGLAVTRTIGDADCPYVSAVPALQTAPGLHLPAFYAVGRFGERSRCCFPAVGRLQPLLRRRGRLLGRGLGCALARSGCHCSPARAWALVHECRSLPCFFRLSLGRRAGARVRHGHGRGRAGDDQGAQDARLARRHHLRRRVAGAAAVGSERATTKAKESDARAALPSVQQRRLVSEFIGRVVVRVHTPWADAAALALRVAHGLARVQRQRLGAVGQRNGRLGLGGWGRGGRTRGAGVALARCTCQGGPVSANPGDYLECGIEVASSPRKLT